MFQDGGVISGARFCWKFKMKMNVATSKPSGDLEKRSFSSVEEPNGKGLSSKHKV